MTKMPGKRKQPEGCDTTHDSYENQTGMSSKTTRQVKRGKRKGRKIILILNMFKDIVIGKVKHNVLVQCLKVIIKRTSIIVIRKTCLCGFNIFVF